MRWVARERYDAVIGRQRQCLADGAAEVGRSELEALRVLERALDRGERVTAPGREQQL